jgi:hypothetical protein
MNIFKTIAKVLPTTLVTYNKFSARTTNNVGQYINTFKAPTSLRVNIQPVEQKLYAQMGLALKKNYVTVHIPKDITGLSAGVSGDTIELNSKTYQFININDWYALKGFSVVTAVQA